jgi:dihydroorotate dehydrogenase electron transfer subunit
LGEKGLVTDTFKKIIDQIPKQELSNSLVYTCGPEKMMYEIFKICQEYSLELQASLERIMRCGCGLCGLCALDPVGLLVCTDGPVFSKKELNKIEDFGKKKRDFSGRLIDL